MRKLIAAALVASMVGAGAAVLSRQSSAFAWLTNRQTAHVTVASPKPAAGVPVRLVIPSLGINSPTKTVGLYKDGSIDTPCDPMAPYGFRASGYSLAWWHAQCNPNASAWFSGSVRPGNVGNAIIDGHVDWYADPHNPHGSPPSYDWTPEIPAVFTNLDHIKVGATIQVVDASGVTRTFVVDRITTLAYPQTPADFYSKSGDSSLTLVTCAGVFASMQTGLTDRLYVHASPAG